MGGGGLGRLVIGMSSLPSWQFYQLPPCPAPWQVCQGALYLLHFFTARPLRDSGTRQAQDHFQHIPHTSARFSMRRTFLLVCSSVLVILLVLAAFSAGQIAGRTPFTKAHPLISGPGAYCASWGVVTSPNVSGESNYLDGVSARSDTDVGAVGYTSIPGTEQSLIEHFNGTGWSIVPSPGPAPLTSQLAGVTALSSNNVWAVGKYGNSGQYGQPLIIHWNGTAWSTISSPTFAFGGQLTAIAAVSANDIWVAGSASPNQTVNAGLLEHWNGASWTVVSSPNPPNTPYGPAVVALAAIATNDVWAIGSYQNQAGTSQTLAMHWDGSTWSIVATPNPPNAAYGASFDGVAARASNDAWAVGYFTTDPNTGNSQSFIEHWNGSAWSIVANPNRGTSTVLFSVSAVPGALGVWAAGEYFDATTSAWYPLTERWDGRVWSIIHTPTASAALTSGLGAIAAITPTDVWAVGGFSVSASIHKGTRGRSAMSSTGPHALSDVAPFSAAYQGDTLTEHYVSRSTPTGACPR